VQNPQVERQHGKNKEVEYDPKEEWVQSKELEMKPTKSAKNRPRT
jgi:hypothetical protein